VRCFRHSAAP